MPPRLDKDGAVRGRRRAGGLWQRRRRGRGCGRRGRARLERAGEVAVARADVDDAQGVHGGRGAGASAATREAIRATSCAFFWDMPCAPSSASSGASTARSCARSPARPPRRTTTLDARWTACYGPAFVYRGFLSGPRLMSTDPRRHRAHADDYPKPDFVRDTAPGARSGARSSCVLFIATHRCAAKLLVCRRLRSQRHTSARSRLSSTAIPPRCVSTFRSYIIFTPCGCATSS